MSHSRSRPPTRHRASGKSLLILLFLVGLVGWFYASQVEKKPLPAEAPAASARAKRPGIVMFYSAPNCEPCDRAREWLKSRNLRFDERNVERSPTAQRELEKLGSRIVPVIVLNGEPFYGFLPAHLDAALRGESTQQR